MNQFLFKTVCFVSLMLLVKPSFSQIGKCKGKYLGNIIAGNVPSNYSALWNQVTSENGSKWGSVEGTFGQYNFGGSDVCYNWAKNNNGLFKYHNLMWGGQTPGWVSTASTATIMNNIDPYFKAVRDHYAPMGGLKLIDVLNEPINTPMPGNLKAALTAGYQAEPANANDLNNQYGWAIWCFQVARKYFPDATLLINEYNTEMNWNNCRAPYLAMTAAIKNAPNLTDGQKNLIDGVGLQAHGIDNLTAANFKAYLDEIWTKTGVSIHITEFDQQANPNEAKQQAVYSSLIPIAWEHPHVAGITLWGYIQGSTWIPGNGTVGPSGTDTGILYSGSYGANPLGERPAMTWLKSYFAAQPSLACCPAPAPFGSCTLTCTPPAATITASGALTFCTGNSVILNANTGTGFTYVWKNGTTILTGATTSSLTATTAGNYTVTVTNPGGCSTTSTLTSVTVNAPPSAPTVTASQISYCQGAIATQLTASGTALNWYATATGGTATTTAPTPSTATIGTTNYYVSQTSNGCESSRTMIAVTVNSLPIAVISTTSSTTFCTGGSVVLTASSGASYKWFNGTTQVGTAATYSATTSGSYTVEVTNAANCKASSAATTVTVNAPPAAPTVSAPQIAYCQGAIATQLTASGTALNWYATATGGTATTTAPTPSTTTVGTTNYYVSQTTNGCEGGRAMIAVTVNALPIASISTTTPTTFCTGGSVVLTASSGASYKWFNGTTQVATAATYSATASGSYTVEVTNAANCKASSAGTSVTVNAPPTAPAVSATPIAYCQGAAATQLTASGTGLNWYATATAGTATTTAPTPSTATTGTTNYYVSQTTNGCESSRAMIAVTVNVLPTAKITANGPTSFPQGGSVDLIANTGTGFSYKWFKGNVQVGTGLSYKAIAPGDYTVEVTNSNTCSATSPAVTITYAIITGIHSLKNTDVLNILIYPNPSSEVVFIDADEDFSDATFTMVDMLGSEHRMLHTTNGVQTRIELNQLATGTYFLIIKNDNSVWRKKLTVISK
jgi:GH35 family endo-1,4-beta-xylanase